MDDSDGHPLGNRAHRRARQRCGRIARTGKTKVRTPASQAAVNAACWPVWTHSSFRAAVAGALFSAASACCPPAEAVAACAASPACSSHTAGRLFQHPVAESGTSAVTHRGHAIRGVRACCSAPLGGSERAARLQVTAGHRAPQLVPAASDTSRSGGQHPCMLPGERRSALSPPQQLAWAPLAACSASPR